MSGRLQAASARLEPVRTDRRRRWAALILATGLGLGLAWMHWLGLVAAGTLVGLASRSLPRALAAAVGFGALVLAAFLVVTPTASVGELLALRPAVFVTVGAGLILPVLGALARGVV